MLADFPRFVITGEEKDRPKGTYATWLPQLASRLQGQDEFAITWVCIDGAINQPVEMTAWNQDFFFIPRWKKSVAMLTGYWNDRRKLKSILRRLNPDLIHAWGSEGAYAMALLSCQNKPSVLSMQGILTHLCAIARQPWLMRIQAFYEAKVLRRLQTITCESEWGIEKARSYAPQADFHHIEYGVNPEYLGVSRDPSPEKVAVYVGGFSFLKGSDTLVEAFRDERLQDVSLKILGATAEEAGVEDCPSNVEFLGRLPVDEVKNWMSKAWCLVHPTRADTSPNCVKEARVVGLPVVTTPEGGQTQYVKHGKSGWLHLPGDVEGLIEGVLTVTRSVEGSVNMGDFEKNLCRDELNPDNTVLSLMAVYRSILS